MYFHIIVISCEGCHRLSSRKNIFLCIFMCTHLHSCKVYICDKYFENFLQKKNNIFKLSVVVQCFWWLDAIFALHVCCPNRVGYADCNCFCVVAGELFLSFKLGLKGKENPAVSECRLCLFFLNNPVGYTSLSIHKCSHTQMWGILIMS